MTFTTPDIDIEDGQKTYRNYKGVKIYRVKEMVIGSDFRIGLNDLVIKTKPKYDIYYKYRSGYKESTLQEAKESIDRVEATCQATAKRAGGEYDKEIFLEVMNSE